MDPDLSRAVALGATDATVTAAGPVSADRPHGGAPAPAAPAAPAANPASAAAGENAVAAAAQAVASNVNVSVRIFSPGNDGPVTQTNAAGPVSVTTTTTAPAAPPSAVPVPVTVPPVPAVPTSWVWNWTWTAGPTGCTSTPSPSTSMLVGSTWTWNWAWPCAPALPDIPGLSIPGFLPRPDAVPALAGPSGASDGASAAGEGDRNTDAWTPPGRPGIRRSLATGERSANTGTMWGTLDAPPTRRGRSGAGSGADAAPAVARVVDSSLQNLIHSGLTASVAAATAAASGGSAVSGLGVGAAALLAALVLFAPPILLPLRAAAARRLPHVSARRDRPG